MNAKKQGSLSSSPHSLDDIILCKKFPTWPTDVQRRLIREYQIRIGAKPFSPSNAGNEDEFHGPAVGPTSKVSTSKALRRKSFQEVMMEKGNKAVL